MVGSLLIWADAHGYKLVGGELQRSKAQAQANAQAGVGIVNSLHLLALAIDLHILREDGTYETDSAAYRALGEEWKSLGGSWGGRFARPDGNHFSLEHNNVR